MDTASLIRAAADHGAGLDAAEEHAWIGYESAFPALLGHTHDAAADLAEAQPPG